LTLRVKLVLSLLFTLIMLVGFPPKSGKTQTEEIQPVWGPYITGTTETETVLNWKTAAETWGVVQYATDEHYALHGRYEDFIISPVPRQLHQVRLTGLEDAQKYRYRIWILDSEVTQNSLQSQKASDAETWLRLHGASTQDFSFSTLGKQSFTFVVYGDSQEQTPWFTQMDRHKLVADSIAKEEELSFVVHLGDFTYDADDLEGWDLFFEAARQMLANSTIYPVMGNHEDRSSLYYEIFGTPAHYKFQSGEQRFLVLDTNNQADFEAQRSWLQHQLSSASKWNFVFFHHPAYSSDARNYGGWEFSRRFWEDIFVDAGVSAVFNGHVHAYERYLVRGLNYFVVGTGGGALTDLSKDVPQGYQNRLAKTLGYARVSVESDRVTVDMVKVARISDDNLQVLEIYPFDTIFETVLIEPDEGSAIPQKPVGDFKVSPVSLRISVDSNSSYRFNMTITSSHDALIHIAAEDLPFDVKPAVLQIQASEQPQKFELEIFGNQAVANGEYEGKLTFLRDVGDTVAMGIKIKTTVSQSGEEHSRGENLYLILAVVLVAAANIGGYVAYRKYKAQIVQKKDV
jgi:acid phosphatase type 7